MAFVRDVFGVAPHYENADFGEFVLPSGFRLAIFRATGPAAKFFSPEGPRGACALGLTVTDVDALYRAIEQRLAELGAAVSGPPKAHPWGEKSFLLVDPDGNRWEIAQSPTADGKLVDLAPGS